MIENKKNKKAILKPEMMKVMFEYFNSDIVNYQHALNNFIIQKKKLKPRPIPANSTDHIRKTTIKEYKNKIYFFDQQIQLLRGRINLASNLRSFVKTWLEELNQPS